MDILPLSYKSISHFYPSLKLAYFCENEVEISNIVAQQSILEHKSGQRFSVLFLIFKIIYDSVFKKCNAIINRSQINVISVLYLTHLHIMVMNRE